MKYTFDDYYCTLLSSYTYQDPCTIVMLRLYFSIERKINSLK